MLSPKAATTRVIGIVVFPLYRVKRKARGKTIKVGGCLNNDFRHRLESVNRWSLERRWDACGTEHASNGDLARTDFPAKWNGPSRQSEFAGANRAAQTERCQRTYNALLVDWPGDALAGVWERYVGISSIGLFSNTPPSIVLVVDCCVGAHRRESRSSKLRHDQALSTSWRSSLLALKKGILFGGTSTRAPVFGLRPVRPPRWRVLKVPNPRISTMLPDRNARTMLSSIVQTTMSASFKGSPMTWRTSSVSSALVNLASVRSINKREYHGVFHAPKRVMAWRREQEDQHHYSSPILSLTACRSRCLQPKYRSVVSTETWPSRN